MAIKKILSIPANMCSKVDELCTAMAKEFVDPMGVPYFKFKVENGALCAEGDAWAKKANERPSMGTMASFAQGYLKCLIHHSGTNLCTSTPT